MTVKDLLEFVKEEDFRVEIDYTETDFQYILDVAEAIWSYGGYPIQEIQSSVGSSTHLKIII
jgi:hypothetical protein